MSKLLASLMRNYFPKRPSGSPLHTLSKLYDVPVGFEPTPLFWGSILLILRSPKGGCCSISDDLSCSLSYFSFLLGPIGLVSNLFLPHHVVHWHHVFCTLFSCLSIDRSQFLVISCDCIFGFIGKSKFEMCEPQCELWVPYILRNYQWFVIKLLSLFLKQTYYTEGHFIIFQSIYASNASLKYNNAIFPIVILQIHLLASHWLFRGDYTFMLTAAAIYMARVTSRKLHCGVLKTQFFSMSQQVFPVQCIASLAQRLYCQVSAQLVFFSVYSKILWINDSLVWLNIPLAKGSWKIKSKHSNKRLLSQHKPTLLDCWFKFTCLAIKRNYYLLLLTINFKINSKSIGMYDICTHDWPLYTGNLYEVGHL